MITKTSDLKEKTTVDKKREVSYSLLKRVKSKSKKLPPQTSSVKFKGKVKRVKNMFYVTIFNNKKRDGVNIYLRSPIVVADKKGKERIAYGEIIKMGYIKF